MAVWVGTSNKSAAWSVRTRLCSLGIRQPNERSPASRWATGRCIFTGGQCCRDGGVVSP